MTQLAWIWHPDQGQSIPTFRTAVVDRAVYTLGFSGKVARSNWLRQPGSTHQPTKTVIATEEKDPSCKAASPAPPCPYSNSFSTRTRPSFPKPENFPGCQVRSR